MAEESEVEACPFCGVDAIIIYERRRDAWGEVKAESRESVHCPNPKCPGGPTSGRP